LGAGQTALARGEWAAAKRHFQAALAHGEQAEALEGLGLAAWWLDKHDLVFESRRRAYRLYRQRKQVVAAARVAVWLAWDSGAFLGEMAVANGWLQRAHTLLEGQPDCAEHAWLAVREGVRALLEDGDAERALALADHAIAVARRVGSVDFEMVGGALRGFALVTAGQAADGMRQLDEVNAAVLAGELTDPIAIGLACCYLVAACERAHDADRAIQWTRRLRRFCTHWGLRPLLAVCRTQYASVCVWRGDWVEAERELVTATDELTTSRPGMSGEGQSRLGELRRRQGRLDEAADLFEEAGAHPLATLGRIALSLDRGEPKKAIDLAERYLRQLPDKNQTERAGVLELLARASGMTGASDLAIRASTELDTISQDVPFPHLRAAAAAARAHAALAGGDDQSARRHFEDAVDLFQGSGAPFETARARLDLARTLGRLGQAAVARDEVRQAARALARIAAAFELAQAKALERELDAAGEAAASLPVPAGLSQREREVIRLIATGCSNVAIGRRLFISGHTVHRHVANIFSKLNVRSRSAIVAKAAALGLLPRLT
jgi:DNA-binding CsgD family transcriptional regulator